MADHDITLTVNGAEERLTVEARTLLVHALRDELGYTGPKVGCESGKCGACTVHLDGEAVKSCTTLAVQVDGREVTTVEGLADGEDDLHPVQEALHECHGLQCGFCTPGMATTIASLLEDAGDGTAASAGVTEESVRHALKGNICRCTGYQNIVDAVLAAAGEGVEAVATDGGPTDGGSSEDIRDDGREFPDGVDDGGDA